MRIAFDMDGVVADLHTAYAQAALRLFPELDRSAIATPEVGASPPDDSGTAETEAPETGDALVVTRPIGSVTFVTLPIGLHSILQIWLVPSSKTRAMADGRPLVPSA